MSALFPFNARETRLIWSCPSPGNGVHAWTFSLLRMLARKYSSDESLLEAARAICVEAATRAVPDKELYDQMPNARRMPGRRLRGTNSLASEKAAHAGPWPTVDLSRLEPIIRGGATFADLRSRSPVSLSGASVDATRIVATLFPGNPLLCCGRSLDRASTRRRRDWGGLADMQFIVPSPMSKMWGRNKQGKVAARCLDNVGPRRFLVIEFDFKAGLSSDLDPHQELHPSKSVSQKKIEDHRKAALITRLTEDGLSLQDISSAIICHLAEYVRPTLVLHSGGKSLHAWFYCNDVPVETLRTFMRYAVSLGADPATWTPCQLVRMPGGLRNNGTNAGVRQTVHYFDPGGIGDE